MDYIQFSELYHHGIKGQSWGEKNGPPYPLDYEDHTAEQKKENPKSTIDGKADTKSTKNAKSTKSTSTKTKTKSSTSKSANNSDKKELTEEEKAARKKKILIGAGVTAATVAAVAAVGIAWYKGQKVGATKMETFYNNKNRERAAKAAATRKANAIKHAGQVRINGYADRFAAMNFDGVLRQIKKAK